MDYVLKLNHMMVCEEFHVVVSAVATWCCDNDSSCLWSVESFALQGASRQLGTCVAFCRQELNGWGLVPLLSWLRYIQYGVVAAQQLVWLPSEMAVIT